MSALTIGLTGLLGLLIGSFLNVVIRRVPLGESIVTGDSHCPKCGHVLSWYENIPVLSWLALRGRCRTCSCVIGIRYPLVELAGAIAFTLAAARIDGWFDLAAHLATFAGFIVLSVIDIDTHRVPVVVLYPTLAITTALLIAAAAADDRWSDLGRAAIARGHLRRDRLPRLVARER